MPIGTHEPEPAIDVLHGLTVIDPYRWLEDRTSAETQEWLDSQKRVHDEYFSKLPDLDRLRSRVSKYLSVEVIEQPAKVGNRYFLRRRRQGQEQACLCVRDIDSGTERVLVDPSVYGPYVAVAIHRISEDGRILAYTLKHGGERAEEVRFVDVDTERSLEGLHHSGYARGLAFQSDNTGFYYCHEPEMAAQKNLPHEIRYRRFGDSSDQDRVLLSMPRTEHSRLYLTSDNVNLGAICVRDVDAGFKTDLYVAPRSADLVWHPVFRDKEPPYGPVPHQGKISVATFAGTPNGRVVELSGDGSEGQVIVPEWKAPMGGIHLAEDRIYVSYLADCTTIIRSWAWAGAFLGELAAQPDGSFGLLQSYTGGSDVLFFSHESFSEAPSILEYSATTNSYLRWSKPKGSRSDHRYQIQRVSYPSKDGTRIPIWLVAHDPIKPNECRPAILTGYGGFGASMMPRFSVLVTIMLELGCVFALPNLRGGSEFGREWHEAARRRKRQVAFDDFIAAAQWLCDQGITRSDRLAIFGGSNSGLLVAAAMTQKPHLFRAVLSIAPILDMLRYERFGDARKWKDEYGTVANADDFDSLRAYSPYHHVSEDLNYPSTLFVSGAKDAQCDPAHVRKMGARLQDRIVQTNPILVDYSAERGHAPVLPLSIRIDALTRRIAFLCHELGIAIPWEDLR